MKHSTFPEGLGDVLNSQDLESEFEQKINRDIWLKDQRAKLAQALSEQRNINERVLVLEQELFSAAYISVRSRAFQKSSKSLRMALFHGKTILVSIENVRGEYAQVIPFDDTVNATEKIKYSAFSKSTRQYVRRAMQGDTFILLFGQKAEPIGLLKALTEESERAMAFLEKSQL